MATMALVPKEPLPQPKQRLGPVLAACMFGNTFTLPLLFLTSLLGAEQMRIAAVRCEQSRACRSDASLIRDMLVMFCLPATGLHCGIHSGMVSMAVGRGVCTT